MIDDDQPRSHASTMVGAYCEDAETAYTGARALVHLRRIAQGSTEQSGVVRRLLLALHEGDLLRDLRGLDQPLQHALQAVLRMHMTASGAGEALLSPEELDDLASSERLRRPSKPGD